MHIIGLIAEYNPFHSGHLYQIKKIKEIYPDSILVAVVSSYFTQRGEVSVLDKWTKTQIALDNNIDIVVELPYVFATQSSDIFAKGAISILNKLKIDTLVFGTEREDISPITFVADLQLNNPKYNILVKEYLSKGLNYPTATNKAIEVLGGEKINSPNDLLALSYIKEIKKQNPSIKITNIQRTTPYYTTTTKNNITSATNLRRKIKNNEDISKFIPYSPNNIQKININNYYPYLKYKIITLDKNINKYQTVEEGIENRILKYIEKSNTYEELIKNIKTKRYTYNKISRMLLHILVDFTKEDAKNNEVDYLRILGFTHSGQKYLNTIKKDIQVPIITGYQENISKILDIELKVSKIYFLEATPNQIQREYNKKPIIKNN